MCGPKFCSMHHSRTIDDGIAAMAREAGLAENGLPIVDGSSEPSTSELAAAQGDD
jgi:hypothetical protein